MQVVCFAATITIFSKLILVAQSDQKWNFTLAPAILNKGLPKP